MLFFIFFIGITSAFANVKVEGGRISVDAKGIALGELVKEIKNAHELIAEQLEEKDLGLKLQFTDSQIMSRILLKTVKENILVVPVHDSVICKKSDLKRVKEIMLEAYFEETGFKGFIG